MTTAIITTEQTTLSTVVYQMDRNPALVYLASLAESSRRPMKEGLNLIANLIQPGCDYLAFPWHVLRYQHTTAIRTQLADKYSASTANRHLSALRGVLKEAWRLGYVTAEEYQRAIDIKTIKGQKAKAAEKGRHIKQGEFGALLSTCDDGTKAGVRDAALIAVGYVAGLRRAELAALTMADWNMEDCTLTIKHGKGNKERVVPVADGACDALRDWLDVRGPWSGPIFTPVNKSDDVLLGGMTDQAIYYIFDRRAKQAGVKAFAPHDLRRTFAGDLLDAGADISTVQKLMGHSNANTTAGYDRRDAKAKRAAVNKLHIPYTKKNK